MISFLMTLHVSSVKTGVLHLPFLFLFLSNLDVKSQASILWGFANYLDVVVVDEKDKVDEEDVEEQEVCCEVEVVEVEMTVILCRR